MELLSWLVHVCSTEPIPSSAACRRSPNLQRFHFMVCSPIDAQAAEAGSLRLQMVMDGTVSSGMRQSISLVRRMAQ